MRSNLQNLCKAHVLNNVNKSAVCCNPLGVCVGQFVRRRLTEAPTLHAGGLSQAGRHVSHSASRFLTNECFALM